ncbi:unnamed protein product [Acanthoscelides obtectus]|uniref:Aldehyde dehydrogenase domain-containing protein n=1 Tax=Acanthoscelides obtectus TaxID=200917 RepID=A0A9P0PXD0_ACAOB|nr:unnamed protein product [Acanthoscelides obtectus]CAK1630289.1 Aldehyde dehydrogenase family 16 member A1 [Acanthoscelides obtectus]
MKGDSISPKSNSYRCEDHFNEWLKTTFFPTLGPNSIDVNDVINKQKLCSVSIPENIDQLVDSILEPDDLDRQKRSMLLEKLATSVEQNSELLAQIEAATRGILLRDTKQKVVPILKEYFIYYSTFPLQYSIDDKKTVVGVFSNETPLINVGLFIAPALASGCRIIVQAGTKIFLALHLIKELAASIGFHSITVIPSDDNHLSTYIGSSVELSVVVLFDDLLDKKYSTVPDEKTNTRIVYLTNYRIPAIIFDDADLHAATEGIISAAWSKWAHSSVGTVFVQESILDQFLDMLKKKLSHLKVGPSNEKLADISQCISDLSCLKKTLESSLCMEKFQVLKNDDIWQPTLILGGKVDDGQAFSSTEDDGQVLTVLSFRSIEEAISMANSSKQGLAASVWSENLCLINEVVRKLKVTNIWINGTYGTTAANVTFTPLKGSGVGNFGGVEGFFELLSPYDAFIPKAENDSDKNISSAIGAAKKGQECWGKISKIKKKLLLLAKLKDLLNKHFSSNAEDYYSIIYRYFNGRDSSFATTQSGFDLVSYQEPRGVVAVGNIQDKHAIYVTVRALYEGNAVISQHWIAKELGPLLPDGVLKYIPDTAEATRAVESHNDVQVFFGSWNAEMLPPSHVTDSSNIQSILEEEFYNKVSVVKNVWCDVGKSSLCNFGE